MDVAAPPRLSRSYMLQGYPSPWALRIPGILYSKTLEKFVFMSKTLTEPFLAIPVGKKERKKVARFDLFTSLIERRICCFCALC